MRSEDRVKRLVRKIGLILEKTRGCALRTKGHKRTFSGTEMMSKIFCISELISTKNNGLFHKITQTQKILEDREIITLNLDEIFHLFMIT